MLAAQGRRLYAHEAVTAAAAISQTTVVAAPATTLAFSVCTLVTDHAAYTAMQASFVAHGFGPETAEFLHLDNSGGNRWCAYRGLSHFLGQARAQVIIFCHQDVRLIGDGAAVLADRFAALDADWAVAGNAGVTAQGSPVTRITDPHGADQRRGPFPSAVTSLDENLLLIRADAGIAPSADLRGFHLYGTDLCLAARQAGRSAWVIDFHLHHLSPGRVDAGFLEEQEAFEHAWGRRLGRSSRIRTTCTSLTLRGCWRGRLLGAWRLARRRHGLRHRL